MRYSYLLVLWVCWAIPTTASAWTTSPADTVLPADIVYNGYRIHVRGISVLKQRGDEFLVRLEAINTGRRPVSFGPGFPAHYLQTVFDGSLSRGGLLPLAGSIRESLVRSDMSFEVGDWQRGIDFWVRPGALERVTLRTDDFEATAVKVRRRPTGQEVLAKADTSAASSSLEGEACVSLTVSDVGIAVSDAKHAQVTVTFENAGTKAIAYAALPDGLAISLYLSGSPELNASAKLIGGADVAAAFQKRDGVALLPGRQATVTVDADIRTATRYTNVILAQFDPGQLLRECDETDNLSHVLLNP